MTVGVGRAPLARECVVADDATKVAVVAKGGIYVETAEAVDEA